MFVYATLLLTSRSSSPKVTVPFRSFTSRDLKIQERREILQILTTQQVDALMLTLRLSMAVKYVMVVPVIVLVVSKLTLLRFFSFTRLNFAKLAATALGSYGQSSVMVLPFTSTPLMVSVQGLFSFSRPVRTHWKSNVSSSKLFTFDPS
ncbi:hypothetical protein BDP81DRAFT_215479 [Colletotrichum phormii]|uniref:Uncharacterized protein n=1 Tax=Colletotrichum phormii TaxID=359342 RepID=A0AAI9ZU83_9PEZI|nr:uncharacterized protein BDP81DRAFT_215479 [Colletotrichum phormii]KAK1637935.1 hypothetical protein BDP81DRAFT_215479 [Colletotrichum phormii]